MRVAFLGTDRLGELALRAIYASNHEVVLVITQPDRPSGRGRKIKPGVVKLAAGELGIPLMQPEKVKEPVVQERLTELSPDILTVVSYGEYIPSRIYSAPPYKAINVHPSLLPRWRGAAPIRYALLAGDKVTGVTVQYLHKKMDAGDIILQKQVPIEPDDDHGSLCERLYPLGAEMLVSALNSLEIGAVTPVLQDENNVTQAPKIQKSDLWINWSRPSQEIRNRIRALSPAPGAKAFFRGENCKILKAVLEEEAVGESVEPGTIIDVRKKGPVVAGSECSLILTMLQPAGKKPQDGSSFVNGYHPETGEKFSGMPEEADN